MSERKAVIKSADMSDTMQQVCRKPGFQHRAIFLHVFSTFACRMPSIVPRKHLTNLILKRILLHVSRHMFTSSSHTRFLISLFPTLDIKREFDKKYGPTWHCIVGRNFGSYVTHEVRLPIFPANT